MSITEVGSRSVALPDSSPEPDWPQDAVEVGRIVAAWGIKGWLKVQPYASDPQALFSSRRWFIKPPEEGGIKRPAGPAASWPTMLKVTMAKEHGDGVVAQADGVVSRNDAEALVGARVFIGRSSFPTAGPDEFYWVDLIGLTVVNRQGELLGQVAGLIDTGPHSVLRVAGPTAIPGAPPSEAERLIPFVAAYVDDVNMALKRITVDWGLDY
jgi:16S rRNA processing protein RimM